jgi:hypothetical protein
MCDYVADCEALQWNTVSYALYRRNPFTFFQPDDVQRHLLVSLAEDSMLDVMIQDGLKFREAVEQSIVALGPSTDGLHSLLADVTYVYLR